MIKRDPNLNNDVIQSWIVWCNCCSFIWNACLSPWFACVLVHNLYINITIKSSKLFYQRTFIAPNAPQLTNRAACLVDPLYGSVDGPKKVAIAVYFAGGVPAAHKLNTYIKSHFVVVWIKVFYIILYIILLTLVPLRQVDVVPILTPDLEQACWIPLKI